MTGFRRSFQTVFCGFLLSGLSLVSLAQPGPPVPPILGGLTLQPATVDVSSADQTVKVTLRVWYAGGDNIFTDLVPSGFVDQTGLYPFLNSLQAALGAPCVPPPATPIPGFSCADLLWSVTIPQGAPAGTYYPWVSLDTLLFGPVYYDKAAFQAAGINTVLTVGSSAPGPGPGCTLPPLGPGGGSGGTSDTTPPALAGACAAPDAVDVRTTSQTIDFWLNITDDLSGFSYGYIYLESPTGSQQPLRQFLDTERTSGDAFSGLYDVPMTIHTGAESGQWIFRVELFDRTGNRNLVDRPEFRFNVQSNADTSPPQWVGATFSPSSVNVTNAPQTVTFDVTLSDDLSGVDSGRPRDSNFTFTSPSGKQSYTIWMPNLTLISGNANSGTWRGQFTLPRYSEAGAWKVGIIHVFDFANNQLNAGPWGGLPASGFAVTSSPSDVTPPVVNGLSFTPMMVNTSIGDQTVELTLAVTDNLSGVNSWPNGAVVEMGCNALIKSPSGQQEAYVGSLLLSAGTPTNAVGKGTWKLPQFSEMGTWSITDIWCSDTVKNEQHMVQADLLAKHFPVNLVVIQPSHTSDGTVGSGGGTVQDAGSAAVLTIPAGALTGNTTVAIDLLAQPPSTPAPRGFSIGTGFVNINLNPPPIGPIPPPGMTLVLPLESYQTPGSSMALYRIDPVSGKLTPAIPVGGGQVIGTVDASGLSATFTGIASFSTVVGLHAPVLPGDLNGDDVVNCADIAIIRGSWGKRSTQTGFDPRADYNGDGVVNIFDLASVSKYLASGAKCK